MGDFDADLARFSSDFVPNVQGSSYHPKWVKANPVEAAKWAAFRDALVADPNATPALPVLATRYGRALVAAGELHMSVSRVVGIMQGDGSHPAPPAPPPPEPPPPTPEGEFGTYNNPWGSTSPWRTLASTRALHANSSALISAFKSGVGAPGFNIGGFCCSVWSDTYHPFARAQWSNPSVPWYWDNVYYPTDYVDSFADGSPWNIEWHSAWLDQTNNRFNCTYNASNPATKTFSAMNGYHLNGSGWWNMNSGYGSPRASGAAPNGGIVTRYDLNPSTPSIEHALSCCIPTQLGNRNTLLSPATYSDQTGTSANGMPMGACIVLDAAINVDTNPSYAGYTAIEKKMLKAIQKYGLYVVDSSSSWAIYFQNYRHGDQAGSLTGYPTSPMSSGSWLNDAHVLAALPTTGWTYETQATNGNQPHH